MTFYAWFSAWMFKYVGSMFMEPNGSVGKYVASLGRASLAALLGLAMWKWLHDFDITASMERVMFALMAYCFGSKATETVREIMSPKPAEPPAQSTTGAPQ